MSRQRWLSLSLVLPVAVLMAWTASLVAKRATGMRYEFAIEGFDPRDLLSGHYLIYRVSYPAPSVCGGSMKAAPAAEGEPVFYCLEAKRFESGINGPSESCRPFLAGVCEGGQFKAGIERFYVPESQAYDLEAKVRAGRGVIRVSVSGSGDGIVEELLIDGQSWQQPSTPNQ